MAEFIRMIENPMERFHLYIQVNLWAEAFAEKKYLRTKISEEYFDELSKRSERATADEEEKSRPKIEEASVEKYDFIPKSDKRRGFVEYKVCFTLKHPSANYEQNLFCWKRYSDFCDLWSTLNTEERTRSGASGFEFPSKIEFTKHKSKVESRREKFHKFMEQIIKIQPLPQMVCDWFEGSFEEKDIRSAH